MAKGDFAVYQNTQLEAVPDDPSFLISAWDTVLAETGQYTNDGQLITIKAGYHLVSYNVGLNSTTPTVNTRTECQLGIVIGAIITPAVSAYGRCTGFVRHKQVDEIPQAYPSGTTLIHTATNKPLSIYMANTDSGTGTIKTHLNTGLQILDLGTTVSCLRAREAGGGQTFPNNTFVQMTWDTSDEADATNFTYNASGSLTIKNVGRYLVMCNVGFKSSGTGANDRSGSEFELRLNGTAISGGRAFAYMRGTGGCQNYVANCSAIIRTFTANSTLTVWCRENSVPVKGFISADVDKSGIVIVALPSTVKTFSVVDNDGTQDVDTLAPLDFAETNYMDTDYYSKDADWRVSYKKTGKYFHFYNFFVEREDTVPVIRHYPFVRFIRDWFSEDDSVATEDRGAGGGFLRGYVSVQPPGSPFTSGSGGLLDFLAVEKYPHGLEKDDAANTTEVSSVYQQNNSRWDAIEINSWLDLDNEVGRHLIPTSDSTAIGMVFSASKGSNRYAMIDSRAGFPDRSPVGSTTYIQRFGEVDGSGQFGLSNPPNWLGANQAILGFVIRWWFTADSTTSGLFQIRFTFYDGAAIIAQSGLIDVPDTASVLQDSININTQLTVKQFRDMEVQIEQLALSPDAATKFRMYDLRVEYQTKEAHGTEKTVPSVSDTEKLIGAIASGTTEKTVDAIASGTTKKTIGTVTQTEKKIADVTSTEKEIN